MKITIDTELGPITLTLEQAEKLYNELDQIFRRQVTYVPSSTITYPKPDDTNWPPPYQPIWCGQNPPDNISLLNEQGYNYE
jgi:hypothetical protein